MACRIIRWLTGPSRGTLQLRINNKGHELMHFVMRLCFPDWVIYEGDVSRDPFSINRPRLPNKVIVKLRSSLYVSLRKYRAIEVLSSHCSLCFLFLPFRKAFKFTEIYMSFKVLSAKIAAQVDQELMSTGGFSIDQLVGIKVLFR